MEEDSLDRGQRTVHYFFQNGEFAKGRGGGVSQFLIARTGWRSKNIFLNFGRIIYSQGTGVM